MLRENVAIQSADGADIELLDPAGAQRAGSLDLGGGRGCGGFGTDRGEGWFDPTRR